ncbi:hypothetical protein [Nocardia mexicana]|uniref:Uncharacterized protein n=1 Tax=Nocardia mexicana TaxID=279262 RepID=A0A370GZM3_9NOCA|nr:hypothetical protein [Nocardia mexicana]RDI49101.1 hypothetical protein DFR68_107227 [Nocardia mexicana]
MQIKSVRGAVVTVAAGAAILGAPAAAQAAPLPLEQAAPQETTTTEQAAPVLALWDPQTGSASLSSNVNAFGLCALQSISAEVQCLGGAN